MKTGEIENIVVGDAVVEDAVVEGVAVGSVEVEEVEVVHTDLLDSSLAAIDASVQTQGRLSIWPYSRWH